MLPQLLSMKRVQARLRGSKYQRSAGPTHGTGQLEGGGRRHTPTEPADSNSE